MKCLRTYLLTLQMLHYFAKDFYASVIASSYVESGKFKLYVVSDLMKVTGSSIPHDETKRLRGRPFDFRGGCGYLLWVILFFPNLW